MTRPTNWKALLKGVALTALAFGAAKLLAIVIFPDPAKTYSQYAREVLASDVPERLAHTQTDRIKEELGATSSQVDWRATETFLATCVRNDMTQWLTDKSDPRQNEDIRTGDWKAWAKQFNDDCLHKIPVSTGLELDPIQK